MNKWAKRWIAFLNKHKLTILALMGSASIGASVFLILFGVDVLNVTNVAWLRQGNDLNQHFLGWQFFRKSEWGFPIGMVHDMAYPMTVSITYLDSIPLAALFFKILSPILPGTFQYLGLWAFGSYVLQGFFGGLIARRFTKNIPLILLVASFFVISPILFSRTFVHTALASHWVILAALAMVAYCSKLRASKHALILWSLLFICAALVHPYFLPMVTAVFAIYNIFIFHKHLIVRQLLQALIPPFLALLALLSIGAFSLRPTVGDNGLNVFNMNLLAPFNPMGWSFYLSSLPSHNEFSESFNFLGLGILILILMLFSVSAFRYHSGYMTIVKKHGIKLAGALFTAITYLYFSVGPDVYLGTINIINIPTPEIIEKIWGIFRANARMFWVIYYAIYTCVLVAMILAFKRKPKVLIAILLSVFIVGTSDFYYSNATKERRASIIERAKMSGNNQSNLQMNSYAQYDHIIILDDDLTPSQKLYIGNFADINSMSVNDSYFARSPADNIERLRSASIKQILSGSIPNNTAYIVKKESPLVSKIQLYNLRTSSMTLHDTSYIVVSHI